MAAALWVIIASSLAVLTVIFTVLDLRKCDREHYRQKYGYKSGSFWCLFALICGFAAYLMFHQMSAR